MKKTVIYLDTSVIGGCFDLEFEKWSNGLIKDFENGFFKGATSEVVASELSLAPPLVKEKYLEFLKDKENTSSLEEFKENINLFNQSENDDLLMKKPEKKSFSLKEKNQEIQNFLEEKNLFDEDLPFDFSSIMEEIFGEDYNKNGTNLILELLQNLNLEQEIIKARNELLISPKTKQSKIIKRIRILENFIATKMPTIKELKEAISTKRPFFKPL
jgi:hypothetical protein